MKKLVILLTIAFAVCSFTSGDKMNWYSWDEGYKLAKQENKPVMIFMMASWCSMCKRMNDKTFTDKDVITVLKKDYIPIKLDIDQAAKGNDTFDFDGKKISGQELIIKFLPGPMVSIPTTVVWNMTSDKKATVGGIQTPEEMKEFLLSNLAN
jgi:thioredoxin-related protein